jgi:uncharacterized protein YyaL (SSP411 family)
MPNRLSKESSPYLLQHKDNPVDWYPWGEEAFARARAEDKPIFLSIGYSTCHWCHVMEHESFEQEEVAAALSRGFVAIKVDREERPDVDDIYMQAVQLMTGQGGWPLSLFLTPDRKPFYGGTYFPPTPRWGKPGFPQLLESIGVAWKERREELESSATEMVAHLGTDAQASAAAAAGTPAPELVASAVRVLERQFDDAEGGFGGAPKFPPAMRLELLLRHWLRTGDPAVRAMTEKTLAKMAAGGMYDQVGGGFHRYSVDARWLVPHFEKMLYDNAMLARVYLQAFRAFGNPDDARVARETLDYLLREMTPEEGGFLAAQDADSGGEEGTFYVWNPASLAAAVGAEAAPIVAARFGVTARGNFENGQTVLSVVRSLPELAADFGKPEKEIADELAEARRKMYDVRSRRVAPATDDKLLTDWTALAISAFALAARVLEEPRYEEAACRAADRILERCVRVGRLLHREKAGKADIPGFATDYAYLIEALLDLYEATFVPRYFTEAVRLQAIFDATFADPRGGYFLSALEHDGLILRPKESWDAATPSSNSVAAMNLLRLAVFTGDARYRERSDAIFAAHADLLARAATAFPRLLCALDFQSDPPREIVLAGAPGREDFERLRRAVFASPLFNRVVAHAESAAGIPELAALAEGRAGAAAAAAYVCTGFACQAPVSDPESMRAALDGR